MSVGAVPSLTLNDGRMIPQLGLGVFQIASEATAGAVRTALELGYRHGEPGALRLRARPRG